MIRRHTLLPALLALAALAGCAGSPPVHYLALPRQAAPAPSGAARLLVEVLPIALPERLNRPELVSRAADGAVVVHQEAQWVAPLPDEVRQILDDALWRQTRAADTYQAPLPATASPLPQYRLALRLERFESGPGGADIAAAWTLRPLPRGEADVCRAAVHLAAADADPDAQADLLGEGARRIAADVAESLSRLHQGNAAASCP